MDLRIRGCNAIMSYTAPREGSTHLANPILGQRPATKDVPTGTWGNNLAGLRTTGRPVVAVRVRTPMGDSKWRALGWLRQPPNGPKTAS